MNPQRKTISTKEKATVDWVLFYPHFKDIVLIAPKGLNDIPNYIPVSRNLHSTLPIMKKICRDFASL